MSDLATKDASTTGLNYSRAVRPSAPHRVANLILLSFTLTCIIGRLIVLLIMRHAIPSFYMHVSGVHIHHFVYGFCILSLLGGYAVVCRPTGFAQSACAILYGITLALTFDEFSIWADPQVKAYWQRGSMEAMLLVFAGLLLAAQWPNWRKRNFTGVVSMLVFAAAVIALLVLLFGTESGFPLKYIAPYIRHTEGQGPG